MFDLIITKIKYAHYDFWKLSSQIKHFVIHVVYVMPICNCLGAIVRSLFDDVLTLRLNIYIRFFIIKKWKYKYSSHNLNNCYL
jgi:hypothetical protein